MKITRSLFLPGVMAMFIMLFSRVQAQDMRPEHHVHPDAKWEVRKEYDEQGNLIYYDSYYSKTWKHFNLPDDSLLQHYLKWQQLPGQQKKPFRVIEI